MDQASCPASSRARSCTCYGVQCFTVCIETPSPAHCNVNQLITRCTQAVMRPEDQHSVYPKALLLALRTLAILRSSRLPGFQHTCRTLNRDNALHQNPPPLRLTIRKLPARKATACHVPCQHAPRSLALQQSLLRADMLHSPDGQQESHLPCAQSAHAQGPKPSLQQKSSPVLSAFKLLARGAVILFNQFCGS